MKIEKTIVYGFEAAIRGMRNARMSHDKIDSTFNEPRMVRQTHLADGAIIGESDMKLMTTLIKRGSSHRKWMRMVHIQCDMWLPRYVWTDFDTYKVGTVRNSQGTADRLALGPMLTIDDFEDGMICPEQLAKLRSLQRDLKSGNRTPKVIRECKGNLTESWICMSTVDLNYENAISIWRDRKNHLLPEFSVVMKAWIESLPYMWHFLGAFMPGSYPPKSALVDDVLIGG